MILGFTLIQLLQIIFLIAFIFNSIKFIQNIRKKIKNTKNQVKNKTRYFEGMENNENIKNDKNSKNDNDLIKTLDLEKTKTNVPEPANINVINQYTGIARRSGEYNNKIFNKLEDQTNKLLMKEYGENYMAILDRFDYLLTLKMLDNTLTVDFNNEQQMLSKIEKINKYGDVKKYIDEMKQVVEADMTLDIE